MHKKQVSYLSFDCTTGFSFAKSTLPAKLIQLRKESQEKHVKRIKLAYQKKEMQGLMDVSSCISPSFPRRKFLSKSKSSLNLTTKAESCAVDIQARRKEKFDLLPAKAKSDFPSKNTYSDSSKCNYKSKTGEIKKRRNTCFNNKTKYSSGFSKSYYCPSARNKNTPNAERCPVLDTEVQNENSIFSKDAGASCRNEKGDGKDNELFIKKSAITVKEPKNICSGVKKKPSKIPVLKARAVTKDSSKQNFCHRSQNALEAPKESLQYLIENVTQRINDLCLPPLIEKKDRNLNTQNPFFLPNIDSGVSDENSYKNWYQTFSEQNMPFADKWVNDTFDDRKNFSESFLCQFKDMTITSPPRENNSFCYPTEGNVYKCQDGFKNSKVSKKFEYITESEGSLEPEYGIEETDDEKSKPKLDNTNKWQDICFEAESTITVPSDNDLEIADYRDPAYRNLPDYPNTPYNLRYPRYKFKKDNNIYGSVDVKSVNSENKIKTHKNRRKTCNATPKRIESGKRRKLKKQIFRKKEL